MPDCSESTPVRKWGDVAQNVANPQQCIDTCRTDFFRRLLPHANYTMRDICQKLANANDSTITTSADTMNASNSTHTQNSTRSVRKANQRRDADHSLLMQDLYCCDSALCGVVVDQLGMDQSDSISSTGNGLLFDPGPPSVSGCRVQALYRPDEPPPCVLVESSLMVAPTATPSTTETSALPLPTSTSPETPIPSLPKTTKIAVIAASSVAVLLLLLLLLFLYIRQRRRDSALHPQRRASQASSDGHRRPLFAASTSQIWEPELPDLLLPQQSRNSGASSAGTAAFSQSPRPSITSIPQAQGEKSPAMAMRASTIRWSDSTRREVYPTLPSAPSSSQNDPFQVHESPRTHGSTTFMDESQSHQQFINVNPSKTHLQQQPPYHEAHPSPPNTRFPTVTPSSPSRTAFGPTTFRFGFGARDRASKGNTTTAADSIDSDHSSTHDDYDGNDRDDESVASLSEAKSVGLGVPLSTLRRADSHKNYPIRDSYKSTLTGQSLAEDPPHSSHALPYETPNSQDSQESPNSQDSHGTSSSGRRHDREGDAVSCSSSHYADTLDLDRPPVQPSTPLSLTPVSGHGAAVTTTSIPSSVVAKDPVLLPFHAPPPAASSSLPRAASYHSHVSSSAASAVPPPLTLPRLSTSSSPASPQSSHIYSPGNRTADTSPGIRTTSGIMSSPTSSTPRQSVHRCSGQSTQSTPLTPPPPLRERKLLPTIPASSTTPSLIQSPPRQTSPASTSFRWYPKRDTLSEEPKPETQTRLSPFDRRANVKTGTENESQNSSSTENLGDLENREPTANRATHNENSRPLSRTNPGAKRSADHLPLGQDHPGESDFPPSPVFAPMGAKLEPRREPSPSQMFLLPNNSTGTLGSASASGLEAHESRPVSGSGPSDKRPATLSPETAQNLHHHHQPSPSSQQTPLSHGPVPSCPTPRTTSRKEQQRPRELFPSLMSSPVPNDHGALVGGGGGGPGTPPTDSALPASSAEAAAARGPSATPMYVPAHPGIASLLPSTSSSPSSVASLRQPSPAYSPTGMPPHHPLLAHPRPTADPQGPPKNQHGLTGGKPLDPHQESSGHPPPQAGGPPHPGLPPTYQLNLPSGFHSTHQSNPSNQAPGIRPVPGLQPGFQATPQPGMSGLPALPLLSPPLPPSPRTRFFRRQASVIIEEEEE